MTARALVPPHDLDAERATLAACILDRDALAEVVSVVTAEDFYDPRHRAIYTATLACDETGTVDAVTIAHRLNSMPGDWSAAGGGSYLAEILDSTPAVSHAEDHARIVATAARVRRVLALSQRLTAEAYEAPLDAADWLLDAAARFADAVDIADGRETQIVIGDAVRVEAAEMDRRTREQSAPSGIQTGLACLDRAIGGLKRGNKYTLAAMPGAGKTALALQIAINAGRSGHGVVYLSVEMPREQLTQRAIAQESGVSQVTIERGELSASEWVSATTAFHALDGLPVVIDDAETQTVQTMRAAVRRGLRKLRAKFGDSVRLGLIVLDHLHIATPDAQSRSRNDELTRLSGGTRKIAKEFDCPVLELSQLNRSAQTDPNQIPHLRHLRESGAIEADAFAVFVLHRHDVFIEANATPDGKAQLAIRKCRQGGAIGIHNLDFTGPTMRFRDAGEWDDFPTDDRAEEWHP